MFQCLLAGFSSANKLYAIYIEKIKEVDEYEVHNAYADDREQMIPKQKQKRELGDANLLF